MSARPTPDASWPAWMGAKPASEVAADTQHAALMRDFDRQRLQTLTIACDGYAAMRNLGPDELAHALTLVRRIATATQTEQQADVLAKLDHCIQQLQDEAVDPTPDDDVLRERPEFDARHNYEALAHAARMGGCDLTGAAA